MPGFSGHRVVTTPAAAQRTGARAAGWQLDDPPGVTTVTDTTRYGRTEVITWGRMHPSLTDRGLRQDHAKRNWASHTER